MNKLEAKLKYWQWWKGLLEKSLRRRMPRRTREIRRTDLKYANKVIKALKAGIIVCVLLLILGGCQAGRGALLDIGWSANRLADNIKTPEK